MKIFKIASNNVISEWDYKGHHIIVEEDRDYDVAKLWHYVVTPEGKKLFADISPYDTGEETLKLWIDAGYPKRVGVGPLTKEDLIKIIEQRGN